MIRSLVCLVVVCSPCLLPAQDAGGRDANPKIIAVSVAILEVNGDVQLKDGTSLSTDRFNDLIAKYREEKSLDRYQFFNLASVEDQQASIQFGQEEAIVVGRTMLPARSSGSRGGFGSSPGRSSSRGGFRPPTQNPGARGGSGSSAASDDARGDSGSSARNAGSRGFGGRFANNYAMQQTGTHVQVVSRVRDDGKIVAQLSITSSRVKPAPASEPDESEEGQTPIDFTPSSTDRIQCNTTALLESGVSMVIAAEGEDGDEEASRAYIIVSATVK